MKLKEQIQDIKPPQIEEAIAGENNFKLDVSDPNYIVYKKENITIEVIGGINDVLVSSLRVTLKVYKTNESSPLRIYRSTQVDLFNEGQVNYVVSQICERVQLEKNRCLHLVYDFIETIDNYRRNKAVYTNPKIDIPKEIQSQAKTILKSDDIINSIEELLVNIGVSDSKLGLQLFITSLSRITDSPIHAIVMAPKLIAHELISELLPCLPKEHTREITTMSKHALSYAPTESYWNNKTLVLHQLESIKEKGNTLLEYILQGKSKRLVAQSDTKTGGYQSTKKDVTGTINLISYTNEDYHPAFSSKQTLCVPLKNTNAIKEKLYEKEVKQLAGLHDVNHAMRAKELLQQIQRSLEPMQIYNPIIEQVDLSKFFGSDLKSLSLYLQLVNLITMLHQHQQDVLLKPKGQTLVVQPEYMKLILTLFRDVWIKREDELYFNVRGTFNRIKNHLRKAEPNHYLTITFKLKDIRKHVGRSPVTLQRHLHQLELYGKVERIGGNNRVGYEYQIIEWKEYDHKTKAYEELIKQL